MNEKVHLRSCPGCRAGIRKLRIFEWDEVTFYVECLNVDCRMSGPLGSDIDGAIDRWNRLPRREERGDV